MNRILICEDSNFFRNVFHTYLEKEGYQVEVADNGHDALVKTKENPPDLILLDVMLPGMDGYQVCQILKADPGYRRIPILMCSVRGTKEDEQLGYNSGADVYLPKSGSPDVLLNKIKDLLMNKNAS